MPDWLVIILVMAGVFVLTHFARKSKYSRRPS